MPSSLIVSKTMTEDVLLCTVCVAFTAIFFVIFKFGLKGLYYNQTLIAFNSAQSIFSVDSKIQPDYYSKCRSTSEKR